MQKESKFETISIEIDKNLKDEAERLFESLGLDVNTAINMFLKECIRLQRLPFELDES